ncbi:MAG: hypothetical protein K5898_10765 [Ruminococcus sp.]|uniref:hypothetical protein n=1 Tax=Ruminococcus sp. TaxID=41978 RepID=UPI0025FB39C8|nr:hypothetical protein [Ruminococcus sp.]MCR4795622.1 hypothetical protein [Ruminococcus sp.]
MNNTISNSLKSRTFADTIISCLLCFVELGFAVYHIIEYICGGTPECISNAVYSFIIAVELGLLSLILLEIKKTGKPFSKKIIIKLRAMALVLIIGGLMPRIDEITSEGGNEALSFTLNSTNMLIIFIGIMIGILSEIFVYGHSLQQDNDLIA